MTLESAIKHAEEVAKRKESDLKVYESINEDRPLFIEEENECRKCAEEHRQLAEWLKELKQLREKTRWIPVSERLPNNTDPVNITWVNHNPESYYADIKDKPFTATGHYCNGRWWWYSASCQDYLDEYRHSDVDVMDDAIEVIAWQPLPEPYRAESEG